MRDVFITGATGSIGPDLVAALLASRTAGRVIVLLRPGESGVDGKFEELRSAVGVLLHSTTGGCHLDLDDRLLSVAGDILDQDLALSADHAGMLSTGTEVVVHAAADTRFRGDGCQQRLANVEGTRHVLDWAVKCRSLRRFVLLSTTCVAGQRTGDIGETIDGTPPAFVNAYEETKWGAEQLVATSGLPAAIVRLATCVGRERNGCVRQLGGLHRGIQWLMRGLVPMVPGDPQCPVEMISNELAATTVARAAEFDAPEPVFVCHVAAGAGAPRLGELIAWLAETFRGCHEGWRRGQIQPPDIVNRATFDAFRRTVSVSGDVLFREILDSLDAFLPALLYPKALATENAERLWGGRLPTPDWRRLIQDVLGYCMASDWGHLPRGIGCRA